MMADPNAITPPQTSDEGPLSMGSPSLTSMGSPSPCWSPPRTRVSQRMKGKQTRRQKNRKDLSESGFKLDGPISQLTESFHNIPIRDMDAWVNRSLLSRQEEVRARNGKVSRPMNSFMLYRSAYAERTKKLVGANNHQIVSRVAGMGWKMEPAEIRRKYEELAKLERDNHAASHPDYKFSPNKNAVSTTSRRDNGSPSAMPAHLIEESGFSDMDSEFGGSSISGARLPYTSHSRSNSFDDPYYDDSRHSSPFGGSNSILLPDYVQMSWANTSHPAGMAVVHPSALQGTSSQVEDVTFGGANSHNDMTYGSSLNGLPGATHHELLQPHSAHPMHGLALHDMDPRLLSQGAEASGDAMTSSYASSSSYLGWPDEVGHVYYPTPTAPSMSTSSAPYSHNYLPNMHNIDGREPVWDMHRPVEGMAETTTGEFDMWCTTEAPMPQY